MNKNTRDIRSKGYTLLEFCEKISRSMRWYREHCNKEQNKQNQMIRDFINELESK